MLPWQKQGTWQSTGNTALMHFLGEIKSCDEAKKCFDGTVKTDWDLEDGNESYL